MTATPIVDAEQHREQWLERLRTSVDAQQWDAAHDAVRALSRGSDEAEEPEARATTVSAVLAQWSDEGPLIHEPTGVAELDRLTDGGPVYGARWFLVGAPDAGKTGLMTQIAHTYLTRGIAVGLLAVDEEPGDLVLRLAQREGWSRRECEERDPETLIAIAQALEPYPLQMYDSTWSIERAAADLARYAEAQGLRAMLGVDSLQTVVSDAEDPKESLRERVTARAVAVRRAATHHRLIAIATSEMNRGAYRSVDAAASSNDMAAAKESGAIEFAARVQLTLRSVKDHPDLVDLSVTKNKHGPSGDHVFLELDRARQTYAETDPPEEDTDDAAERDEARAHRTRTRQLDAAAAVAAVLASDPGATTRTLRAAVSARLGGCSHDRCDEAVAVLGTAVVTEPGARRATHHYLHGEQVPDEVLARLDPAERAKVGTSRTPDEVAS